MEVKRLLPAACFLVNPYRVVNKKMPYYAIV